MLWLGLLQGSWTLQTTTTNSRRPCGSLPIYLDFRPMRPQSWRNMLSMWTIPRRFTFFTVPNVAMVFRISCKGIASNPPEILVLPTALRELVYRGLWRLPLFVVDTLASQLSGSTLSFFLKNVTANGEAHQIRESAGIWLSSFVLRYTNLLYLCKESCGKSPHTEISWHKCKDTGMLLSQPR